MFQAVTLLGFTLRRFPLPRPRRCLSAHPACLTLARTDLPTRAKQILARLPGFRLRGSPLSPASRRSGRTRASLGFRSPSRVTLSQRQPALAGLPPSSLGRHVQARTEKPGSSESRSPGASKISEEILSPSWGSCTSSRLGRVSVPNRSQ